VDFFPADDYKMWFDCLQITQIYNIPEILVYYRQHEEQICRENEGIINIKTNKVRLEFLKKVYPDVGASEIEFYLQKFACQNIDSINDYKDCLAFSAKLMNENQKSGYINTDVIQNEMPKYLKSTLKRFLIYKHFKEYTIKNAVKYIFSLDWRYLNFRSNAKFIYNCISNEY